MSEGLARSAGAHRLIAVLAVLGALSGCGGSFDGDESNKVNGSIHVPVGKQSGPATTVNGSIESSALTVVGLTPTATVSFGSLQGEVTAALRASPLYSSCQE